MKNTIIFNEKQLTKKEIGASMYRAINDGGNVKNPCQAHLFNNFPALFNDRFTMNANMKTDQIKCFNLPNVKLQADFLLVIKNNPQLMDLVPEEHKESFIGFINYMKNNKMCHNCSSCRKDCYNNKAYTQYQSKGVCDLRQLYRLINNPQKVIGEIVHATVNDKFARLNGSGEIHNEFILDCYIKLAKSNKDTIYYTYTKNYRLIEGRRLPKNLIINLSDFGTAEKIEASKHLLPNNLNTFMAVTTEQMETIKADKKLAKNICHGVSCSTCKLCTSKKGKTIYCEIH